MRYLDSLCCFYPTDPARLVRTESVPCDINNPVRKPARYSDLHISQTLPKTNKINKVRCGFYRVRGNGADCGDWAGPDGGWEGGKARDGAWLSHSWALLFLGGLCAVKLVGRRETIQWPVEEILRQIASGLEAGLWK